MFRTGKSIETEDKFMVPRWRRDWEVTALEYLGWGLKEENVLGLASGDGESVHEYTLKL